MPQTDICTKKSILTKKTEQKKEIKERETRRDFLQLTATSMGAVSVAGFVWPFVRQMAPSAETLAHSTVDIDLSPIKEGQAITAMWRGKPVFIRHRTKEEIEDVRQTPLSELRHKQKDAERVQKPEWLIVVGICTHLGCVPVGQKETETKGEFGGWFCPCHGAHYDVSGRIRKGPASKNMVVPDYVFLDDSTVRIGVKA